MPKSPVFAGDFAVSEAEGGAFGSSRSPRRVRESLGPGGFEETAAAFEERLRASNERLRTWEAELETLRRRACGGP